MTDANGLLKDLLDVVEFEVIPLAGALEKVSEIPSGSVVSVTASPSRGLGATMDLTTALQERGYHAVPHLAARMIADRRQLEGLIKRLDDAGVVRALIIGGDPEPQGNYLDAWSLLQDMESLGHPFLEVGIAGYPEGHPGIPDDRLRRALHDKAPHATYITTQMCFSARLIADWIRGIRREGVELPVKVGVPGAVNIARLVEVATKIRVGDSMRFLAKNRGVLRILRPGGYRPDRLLQRLARVGDGLDLMGLHVFTLNQVEATVSWHREAKARLR